MGMPTKQASSPSVPLCVGRRIMVEGPPKRGIWLPPRGWFNVRAMMFPLAFFRLTGRMAPWLRQGGRPHLDCRSDSLKLQRYSYFFLSRGPPLTKLTQSYVHGVSATPLIGQTLGAFFDEAVRRWGNCVALVVRHQAVRWTYRQLKEKVDAFAAGLLALGLEPGNRVGIWSPNNAEWVVTQFATARAGLILVNINPAYRLAEADYALNKVECKALVTAGQFKTSDYVGMLNELRAGNRLPHLKTIIRIGGEGSGMIAFDDVAGLARPEHHHRLAEVAARLQFDDPINIQFTSGTTGYPKGATLTHHNILNNGFFI